MGLPWGLRGGALRSTDQLKLMAADESSSRADRAVCAGGVSLHSLSEFCIIIQDTLVPPHDTTDMHHMTRLT